MLIQQAKPRSHLYMLVILASVLIGMTFVLPVQPANAQPYTQLRRDTSTPTRTRTPVPTATYTAIPSNTATRTSTPTPANTSTPVPTATSTPQPCINSGTIVGAITTSDLVQTGRVNRDGVPSSCQSTKSCPMMIDLNLRHYDAYTFANTTGAPSCFTVNVNAGTCVDTQYIFSSAYLLRFDPANLCLNYLADVGISPMPVGSYSFSVPAGAAFVVVVYEIDPNAGCSHYSLTVTNCEACAVQFSDVPPDNTFYSSVRCLACRNIISGYSDGTFRPNSLVTRAQLAKIVSNAASLNDDPNPQIYEDVPPTNPFYQWINRLSKKGYIGGYPCGGPGEPCLSGNKPYFRPAANATRGQTAKIVANAALPTEPPSGQTFEDVPTTHPFYSWIQRLASHGIMGGYPCGGPGEPCGVSDKPYFRPGNLVTRGQSAKIVSNAFFPGCVVP